MKFFVFLVFIVFLFIRPCFSTVDQLAEFKIDHAGLIKTGRVLEISDLREKAKLKRRELEMAECVTALDKHGISGSWRAWFIRYFNGRGAINYREFAAAIFYPYELLETTHKQHVREMNYAFKTSIMYSSLFDPEGPGAIMKNCAYELKNFDGDLFRVLDLGFSATMPSLIRQIEEEEKRRPGFLITIRDHVLSHGTVLQTLNLGSIFKSLGNDIDAAVCFKKSAAMGSMRAKIELGNLQLKTSFAGGLSYFSPIGAYGLWKIAQCYRYGIQTAMDLKKANDFYLAAVADIQASQYPEIFFDAGDFAVYCAYSQPASDVFKKVMHVAIMHFNRAGEQGVGLGYMKAAESSIDTVKRFPALVTAGDPPELREDFRQHVLEEAFLKGHVEKVTNFCEKNGIHFAEDAFKVQVRGICEQVDRDFG